jgi:hypothetical protein
MASLSFSALNLHNLKFRGFGYDRKYGIFQVDFNDPNRKRTEKESAGFFRNVVKTRSVEAKPVSKEDVLRGPPFLVPDDTEER